MSLLELRGVEARYGGTRALDDVSLTVEQDEVVALLGANGAGKTTTLRAVCGTVRTHGEVLLDGERLFPRTPERVARQGVVHVQQGRGTFASLSVLDNLRVGAWVRRGTSSRDLVRVFELFPQLYERRDRRAGSLSGGEQQMLALGRAVMAHPRLLLLDEPSLGLAPSLARELIARAGELSESGTAVLLAEQSAGAALGAASRVYVLDGGRVVHAGDAADVRTDDALRRRYLGY